MVSKLSDHRRPFFCNNGLLAVYVLCFESFCGPAGLPYPGGRAVYGTVVVKSCILRTNYERNKSRPLSLIILQTCMSVSPISQTRAYSFTV